MAAGTAGRRYAQAIFDIAKSENSIDQWSADLSVMEQVFTAPQVKNFLENPKTNRDQKRKLITELLQTRVQPVALRLALLLVQRERQNHISDIVRDFQASVNRLRGIVLATVTTAEPIDDNEAKLVAQRLSAMTGKQVQIERKVDPSIIGGLVARIGDTLIDGSVATRLQELRKQLVRQ
jgi:F-type H+-transporting ATPase subunit delta